MFTFKVEGLSRAALAQLTRHRLASFDVQSQRYVKLVGPELVIPETIRNSRYAAEVENTMRYVMNLYQRLAEDGIPCEDARYVTPQAVPTTLIMTMNAILNVLSIVIREVFASSFFEYHRGRPPSFFLIVTSTAIFFNVTSTATSTVEVTLRIYSWKIQGLETR